MTDSIGDTVVLPTPRAPDTDLSSQIEQSVQREPRDQVKCVRVFDNYYRCNWWAQPKSDAPAKHASIWGIVATQCVRQSRFLNATLVDGKLVIKEMSLPALR